MYSEFYVGWSNEIHQAKYRPCPHASTHGTRRGPPDSGMAHAPAARCPHGSAMNRRGPQLTGSRSAAGVTTTGCRTSGVVIRWHRRSRDRKKGRVALAGSLGAGRTGRVAADVLCWRHPHLRPAARNQEVQRDPNRDGRQSLESGSDISSGNGNLCFCISLIIKTTYRDTLEARVGIEPTNKGFADLLLNRSNFLFVNDLLPRS